MTTHPFLGRALATLALLAMPVPVLAQTAAPAKPAAQAPAKPAGTPQPPAPPQEPYTYNSEGRRDPFVSLVSHGGDPTNNGPRAAGLAGLMTGEISLSGVLQSKGAYLALVKSPDGKTYTAHVNDRLADGTIRSITPQGMVIMQEVNDPLSLVKVKEVRKGLRTSDDVKQ